MNDVIHILDEIPIPSEDVLKATSAAFTQTKPKFSPTPRTDEKAGWIDMVDGSLRTEHQYSPCGRELNIRHFVRADFCRLLEMENQRMTKALKEYADERNWRVNGIFDPNGYCFSGTSIAEEALRVNEPTQ